MSKRFAFTVIGLILSFAIALGGWAITSWLIDIESYRLLSGTTSFTIDTPSLEPLTMYEEDDHNDIRFGLTTSEMVSVLQNREEMFNRRAHEPVPGQIDMETAIIVGRTAIFFLTEQNILPTIGFTNTGAYLIQNISPGEPFLPLRYSNWTVFFSNDDIHVSIVVNSVTGQIWEIAIITRQWHAIGFTAIYPIVTSRNDLISALSTFVTNQGLQPIDSEMYGRLYMMEPDNDAYLVAPPLYPADEGVVIDFIPRPWHFENSLLLGQIIDEEGTRAEILASGTKDVDGTLSFTSLAIRLTASPLIAWAYQDVRPYGQ